MKWHIPAKTFLLGEYAALRNGSAFLVTTSPYFELSVGDNMSPTALKTHSIHPESPAGLWWKQQKLTDNAPEWHDPYNGCGGLGASSAQFIGVYLASCQIQGSAPSLQGMLDAYYQCSWNGQGLRPSGYDLIAQTLHGCVYINKQTQQIHTYSWPFSDLSFFLVHTGVKLATHHHLQKATIPENVDYLSALVDKAKRAFENNYSDLFIECVNTYHQELVQLNLVADHSVTLINQLRKEPEVLAIKGCGALGADIILLITSHHQRDSLHKKLLSKGKYVLASEIDIEQKKTNMFYF